MVPEKVVVMSHCSMVVKCSIDGTLREGLVQCAYGKRFVDCACNMGVEVVAEV